MVGPDKNIEAYLLIAWAEVMQQEEQRGTGSTTVAGRHNWLSQVIDAVNTLSVVSTTPSLCPCYYNTSV